MRVTSITRCVKRSRPVVVLTLLIVAVTCGVPWLLLLSDKTYTVTRGREFPWKHVNNAAQGGELLGAHDTHTAAASEGNKLPLFRERQNKTHFKREVQFQELYYEPRKPPAEFVYWHSKRSSQCGGRFVGYASEFALLTNVTIDMTATKGRIGGENFTKLWNQKEEDEYYTFQPGAFQMNCAEVPKYTFKNRNHLNLWMKSFTKSQGDTVANVIAPVYIAVTRYEYVNMYHTMTDWHNVFLMMSFFNLTQQQTNILYVDGHPWGGLDDTWTTLFNSTLRLGQLPARAQFGTLIAAMQGYNSRFFIGSNDAKLEEFTLLEEFRQFFLSSFNLPTVRPLNCGSLSVMFIWRRPYFAHPRNPSGDVHRKIKNEDEILDHVRNHYPNFTFTGIQTDSLSMYDQLRHASQADVMIGMHGAGLSLCLFIPKHGALLELMPNYIRPEWKKHFISMATWRKIIFKRWVNKDSKLEYPDHYTRIPPEVISKHIDEIHSEMCRLKPGGTL